MRGAPELGQNAPALSPKFTISRGGQAKYKATWGSKTDLQTGEHIQFEILEDGSHKETRRFPVEDDDDEDDEASEALNQKVHGLVRRIKALIEKGDRTADKAEQFLQSGRYPH